MYSGCMGLLRRCRRVSVSSTLCELGRGVGGVGVSKFV